MFIYSLCFYIFWVLYGGNVWNGDREAYELYYARDGISPWGVEILYGYINIFLQFRDIIPEIPSFYFISNPYYN